MKDDILDKLRDVLTSGIVTEAQVLFVLVKTRKLLEMREKGPNYHALKFFCDWALHSRLDKDGAQNIIRQFDKVIVPWIAHDMDQFATLMKEIEDLLTAERFRQELQHFLGVHGLPTRLTNDSSVWQTFLRIYISSVQDTPLEIKPLPVKHVQSVTIQKDEESPSRLNWAVKTFDNPNPILFPFHF